MTTPANLIANYDQEQAAAKADLAEMVAAHRRLVAEAGPMIASVKTFRMIEDLPGINQTALAALAIAALAEQGAPDERKAPTE